MRTSNVLLAAVAVVASAFLLWLWFYLGFDKVDAPLDLVLSVLWWVVIAACVALVARFEKVRRERVRTAYVGVGRLYNSEAGLLALDPGASVADSVAEVLASLRYGFDHAEPPAASGEGAVRWSHVVRTARYEPARDDDGSHEGETWEGEVVVVETGRAVPFSSRAELARIIG